MIQDHTGLDLLCTVILSDRRDSRFVRKRRRLPCYMLYGRITHKDTVLYTALVNVAAGEDLTQELTGDFLDYLNFCKVCHGIARYYTVRTLDICSGIWKLLRLTLAYQQNIGNSGPSARRFSLSLSSLTPSSSCTSSHCSQGSTIRPLPCSKTRS